MTPLGSHLLAQHLADTTPPRKGHVPKVGFFLLTWAVIATCLALRGCK